MKYINPFYVVLILFTISSCSDENLESEIVPEILEKRLTHLYVNDKLASEYIYSDDFRKMIHNSYNSDGEVYYETTYNYTVDTVFLERKILETNEFVYFKYYKISDLELKLELVSTNGNFSYYIESFDEQCGVQREEYYNSENQLISYTDYNYDFDHCNYEKIWEASSGYGRSQDKIILDNKKNATSINRHFGLVPHSNIVSRTRYNDDDSMNESLSYNSTYVYYEQEYPAQQNRTYSDGRKTVIKYIYNE